MRSRWWSLAIFLLILGAGKQTAQAEINGEHALQLGEELIAQQLVVQSPLVPSASEVAAWKILA